VVQPDGNCSLDVLKILEIKWPLLSPLILTIYKRKVIHARYSDWTEILCETVFPQIDSRIENIKHIFYFFMCTTVSISPTRSTADGMMACGFFDLKEHL